MQLSCCVFKNTRISLRRGYALWHYFLFANEREGNENAGAGKNTLHHMHTGLLHGGRGGGLLFSQVGLIQTEWKGKHGAGLLVRV